MTGRTVGIVGCGHVGKDLVLLLKAFGCRILAHDIRDFPEFYRRTGVEPLDLETLLRLSDVVTLHLPKSAANNEPDFQGASGLNEARCAAR